MKRFSKFVIWLMAYIGCLSTIESYFTSNIAIFIFQFIAILSFFIWAFYDASSTSKSNKKLEETDMRAIVFTKDDLKRLMDNYAVVMTADDGTNIYFMSEECYEKSYKDE